MLGLFSYYSQWMPKFSDKIRPLITANLFPPWFRINKNIWKLQGGNWKGLIAPSRRKDTSRSWNRCLWYCYCSHSESSKPSTGIHFTHTYDYRTKTFFHRKGGLCNSRVSQKVVTLPISATFCDSHRSTSCEFHVWCKKAKKDQEQQDRKMENGIRVLCVWHHVPTRKKQYPSWYALTYPVQCTQHHGKIAWNTRKSLSSGHYQVGSFR